MSTVHLKYDSDNFKRVSDAEIAQAKARRIEDVVGAVLPIKRDFALCPFHSEKSPSFHVDRKRNVFCCFGCGSKGDTIEFVRRLKRLDFPTAVRELCEGISGPRYVPAQRPETVQRAEIPLASILSLWRSATAPEIAHFYIETRNLRLTALPEALRGHKRVWCAETKQHRPAMLAAISDDRGLITSIQRTWVTPRLEYDGHMTFPRGARAPDLRAGKKCLGLLGSGAVRLAAAGEVLGLAEGVETALAASRLFGVPVWATCGQGRLGAVQMPAGVRHVVIFGDRGGETAAAAAERAYRQRGYGAQVEFPECGKDFADQVAAE